MLLKKDGLVIPVCDYCEEELDTEPVDFEEAISTMKDNSWINRKMHSGWHQFCCRDCYDAYKSDEC